MKKLIVGLMAAFLMTTGLVAFSGSPAQAACPYSGCVDTATVAVSVPKRKSVKIKVKVVALGSNATPSGNVYLVLKKVKKNGNLKRVATLSGSINNSGRNVFKVGGLHKNNNYKFNVKFNGNQSEGFRNSIGFGRFNTK